MADQQVPVAGPSAPSGRRPGRRGAILIVVAALIVVGGAVAFLPPNRPAPSPGPTLPPGTIASPAPSRVPVVQVLPTPSAVSTVLLVASTASLTADERRWLDDMQAALGLVDTLAFADATAERIGRYLTIVLLDRASGLDVDVLKAAFRAGKTIHLVGAAAEYQAQITAVFP
jgi:hypothetical protein